MTLFIQIQKQKQLSMKGTLMKYLIYTAIYTAIIPNIQKYLRKSSGWITDSVIYHNISISKYNPLLASSYIKLLKELDHPRKGFINIQNIDDNECFELSSVRYLSPSDYHPSRIIKTDKDFAKKLDFKDIKLPVKIRDIQKFNISVFGYENKERHLIYLSKMLLS